MQCGPIVLLLSAHCKHFMQLSVTIPEADTYMIIQSNHGIQVIINY